MFHAGAVESLCIIFEQHQQPVRPSTKSKLIFMSSVKETDEYYAAEKKSRERPKVQTTEQVLTKLGSAVTTQTRHLCPRN